VSASAAVAVSVATVWADPEAVRPVDAPALGIPADPGGWVTAMSHRDKLDLQGRAETQVLYGDAVTILEERAGWTQVVVPSQCSGRDLRGYPGWLPAAHLTEPLSARGERVVVDCRLTRLYADPKLDATSVELSFGTVLPVTDRAGGWVQVRTPAARLGWFPESDVAAADGGSRVTGAELLATAAGFLGLPYLWAGVSAYGFDCSGLVHAVHRRHGVAIPRDADDQARAGESVSPDAVEPGDLLFFAYDRGRGDVHHVAMYAGNATMLHAPATGRTVEIIPIETRHYAEELCAARRYR